jgi:hypothetical protein
MIKVICKYVLMLGLSIFAWAWNGEIETFSHGDLVASAKAVVGRPATPVSYAGVARRTTVRMATPGLGAPGVGVQPANRGGPVNRVGIR